MPYNLALVGHREALVASKAIAERYRLSYPEMIYKVLLREESIVNLDERENFYKAGARSDRKYKDYPMYLQAIYSPEQMGLSGMGIDTTRQILFLGASYLFSSAGLDPGKGDLIIWDGDPFEVYTVKPKEDSQVSNTNFFTEVEIVANIPIADMP